MQRTTRARVSTKSATIDRLIKAAREEFAAKGVALARIESIADFIDPATRVIRVRASVDNADRKLKGEMFVTVEVRDHDARTLMIPTAGAFLIGTKHYAFVALDKARFERVEVAVGKTTDGWVAVKSGVQAGQSVVVSGALLLEQVLENSARANGTAVAPS